MTRKLPFSVLDLCPVRSGETPREAMQQSCDLAHHAETLGYKRYWVAEHHGTPSVASAATAVVIGHIAGRTSRIRVGSGGIMLPNHVPLVIAEQFGTLASLYPGRIDLGLGRSAGGEPGNEEIIHALRTGPAARARFPSDVRELQSYFCEVEPGQRVQAVPGAGLSIPLWLLGSSTFSAEEAGKLGLPFVFAAHIASAPNTLMAALKTYRSHFKPSAALNRPYAVVCVLVIAADTDKEAQYLFTSLQQRLIGTAHRKDGLLPPPVDDIDTVATPELLAGIDGRMSYKLVGSRETVHGEIDWLLEATEMDELMVLTVMHDQEAVRSSFTIVAEHEAFEAA